MVVFGSWELALNLVGRLDPRETPKTAQIEQERGALEWIEIKRSLTSPVIALLWAISIAALWCGWAVLTHLAQSGPREDVLTDVVTRVTHVYVRIVHNLHVEGLENLPASNTPGKLVVVANHTAGVDPLLIQAVCPFFVRWMMAKDMQLPLFGIFWNWADVITVDRSQREVGGTREAIRHLADGGVVGIFPEGMLERPPRELMPFIPGIGVIVNRSKAPVLPVIIEGTPQVDPAWSSLWRSSRSTIRFMPVIQYDQLGLRSSAIADDLRKRYAGWTQWPMNDDPPPTFPGGKSKGARADVATV